MKRVFISYSKKDRDFVRRLVDDLHLRLPDVQVFYDMMIVPGDSWADVLSAKIESADVVLAVLSPDYLASEWAKQESMVAIERHIREPNTRFIPLLYRPCAPSRFLSSLTWIDFTEDYEAALPRLIWGITGERPKAAKGEEPGTPTEPISQQDLDALRNEVQEAVRLFKSRIGDSNQPPSSDSTGDDGVKKNRDNKFKCFIVMPFGDTDLQVVYEDFVRPTIENECELVCERGDDVFGSNVIMDDIVHSIESADIVVADLTEKNANVFYEVGICHTLKKPVLLLAQSIDDVPFDLRHRRVLLYEYSPRGCKRLENTLKDNLNAMLDAL